MFSIVFHNFLEICLVLEMVGFFHNFDRFSLALFTEAATRGVLCKKLFLEILQNSQENACARASFLPEPQPASLLKKRLWYRCFPVNFAKFLRTSFSYNTSGRLPLYS